MVRDEGITGFTIVAGDKHSFWAGYPSETLPPRPFEPVGVEMEVEEEFNIQIPNDVQEDIRTVGDIVAGVIRLLEEG